MINITMDYFEERVEITGHSGYAEKGKDIVCAAVSALVRVLEKNVGLRGTVEDDGEKVNIKGGKGETFFNAMCAVEPVLVEIAEKYPEYVGTVWVRN